MKGVAVFVTFFAMLAWNVSTAHGADVRSGWHWPYIPAIDGPVNTTIQLPTNCYDALSGMRLNCYYDFSIQENPAAKGGHGHTRNIGELRNPGTPPGSKATAISGFTNGMDVINEYLVSQMSGGIIMTAKIVPPRTHVCLYPADCTFITYLEIMVPNLLSPPLHPAIRSTGSTASHPDNHYGTASTNATIATIAVQYFKDTGIKIGVNDMSLVSGGLFDIGNSGMPPHNLHRLGKSFDVDHFDQNGLRIVDEKLLDDIADNYDCQRLEKDIGLIHYECQ